MSGVLVVEDRWIAEIPASRAQISAPIEASFPHETQELQLSCLVHTRSPFPLNQRGLPLCRQILNGWCVPDQLSAAEPIALQQSHIDADREINGDAPQLTFPFPHLPQPYLARGIGLLLRQACQPVQERLLGRNPRDQGSEISFRVSRHRAIGMPELFPVHYLGPRANPGWIAVGRSRTDGSYIRVPPVSFPSTVGGQSKSARALWPPNRSLNCASSSSPITR